MSRYTPRDASAVVAGTRPAPEFRVRYQVQGKEEPEQIISPRPPEFVPGFVILTARSGTRVAYPAGLFVNLVWSE